MADTKTCGVTAATPPAQRLARAWRDLALALEDVGGIDTMPPEELRALGARLIDIGQGLQTLADDDTSPGPMERAA